MTNINVEELKFRINNGEELNLIDVRELNERDEFNIGGIHLPIGMVQSMQIDAIEDLKEKEVICYCRSGNRSMMAALVLEQCGFRNVRNLTGGMLAWQGV